MKLLSHTNLVQICIGILVLVLVVHLGVKSNGYRFNSPYTLMEGIDRDKNDEAKEKYHEAKKHEIAVKKECQPKIDEGKECQQRLDEATRARRAAYAEWGGPNQSGSRPEVPRPELIAPSDSNTVGAGHSDDEILSDSESAIGDNTEMGKSSTFVVSPSMW